MLQVLDILHILFNHFKESLHDDVSMFNIKTYCPPERYDKTNLTATTDGSANRPGHRGAISLHEDKAGRHVHTMAVTLSALVASI